MQIIQFKNISTAKVLTLDFELKILRFDEREIFIQDTAVFAVMCYLLTTNESIVNYRTISNVIKNHKSTSHMQDCSDNIIANKYVFKIRSMLKGLLIEDFITTVRGLGYKISNKWLKVSTKDKASKASNELLGEIEELITHCIKYCESAHITQDQSGLCFIKPDEDLAIKNFQKINDFYHLFLEHYSAPGNGIEIIPIREKIIKLLLYAIYWRVGDSLTNEKFKADYKNELLVLSKQIKQDIIALNEQI